jgi:hypothetical protein
MFRLCNFEQVRNPPPKSHSSAGPHSEESVALERSVLGDVDMMASMTPLLQEIEQDASESRRCDPQFATLEVLWVPCHNGDREIAISRLTELINALLRSRSELLEYGSEDIGWKLRSLGLPRHRNRRGMVFRFSQENRLAVHRLATQWRLGLRSVSDCAFCHCGKAADSKGLV